MDIGPVIAQIRVPPLIFDAGAHIGIVNSHLELCHRPISPLYKSVAFHQANSSANMVYNP
jgi:hypothetical protein